MQRGSATDPQTPDPEVTLDQRDMRYLATLGGAQVWHLERQVGSLTVGKRADVILIGSSRPHLDPSTIP